jgi:hypothetical protein
VPAYKSCLRMTVAQGFGDIERIECPDPTDTGPGRACQIRGATERGDHHASRYPMMRSDLLRLRG